MTLKNIKFIHFAIAGSLALASHSSFSNEKNGAYPTRPIKLLVPFAVGGAGDTGARIVADEVAKILGVPLVVENRPGSSGLVGSMSQARAKPDGYTIGYNTNTILATGPYLFKNLSFDPFKDFVPVALVHTSSMVLAVKEDAQVKDAGGLVAWLKANPAINYSYHNSSTQIAGAVLSKVAGKPVTPIPYSSPISAMTDLIGGQLTYGFVEPGVVRPLVEANKIRLVAVSSDKRAAWAPDLPTLKEYGISDMDMKSWGGFIAPAGTPRHVVETLEAAISQALKIPSVRQRFATFYSEIDYLGSDDFQIFIRSQSEMLKQRIEEVGIEPK